MFYYTSNKPISHLPLTFSYLLNSFVLLPVRFLFFAFYIYTFYNLVLYKFSLLLHTSVLLTPIFHSLYVIQTLVHPHGILYTSKCCSILESTKLNISSEATLPTVLLQVVIFGQMDMTMLIVAILQV